MQRSAKLSGLVTPQQNAEGGSHMSTFRKSLFFFALAVINVRPLLAADSLVVNPAHPTILDSIRLSVVIKNWNCCTEFTYDSTSVTLLNDSTITLSFTASQPLVCPLAACVVGMMPILTYKRGPLPAGNYSVYEVESQACTTGQVCPQEVAVVMQALIGKFTVSEPTATVFHQKPVPLESIGKISGNGRVYDIRGALVSPNRLGASRQSPGVYFIKPDENSTAKVKIWY
jgi:hypothetical protein